MPSNIVSTPLRKVSTASTIRSTPKTPLEIRIPEKMHLLQAHCDISTTSTPLIQLTTHPEVVSSTSSPSQEISTTSTATSNQNRVSSATDCLASIVNPTTFVHQGKTYRAIYWPSRQPPSPLIPAKRIYTTTPIVKQSPLDTVETSTLQSPDTSSMDSADSSRSISSPTVLSTDTAPLAAFSTQYTSHTPLSIICRTLSQLLIRYALPYIRNHARLKGTRCDL